jgi:hypothetical protein
MGRKLPERHSKHTRGSRSPYIVGGRTKKRTTVILTKNVREKAWRDQRRLEKQRREEGRAEAELGREEVMEVDGKAEERPAESKSNGKGVGDDGPSSTDGLDPSSIDVDVIDHMDGVEEYNNNSGQQEEPLVIGSGRRQGHRPRTLVPTNDSLKLADAWRALIHEVIASYLAYQESVYKRHLSGFHPGTVLANHCQCRRRTEHKIICLFFECMFYNCFSLKDRKDD